MLGEEVLVHVSSGKHRFTISADPHHKVAAEQPITVCPRMQHAHLFDAETGRNMTVPVSDASAAAPSGTAGQP